jgi:hypothetical protein
MSVYKKLMDARIVLHSKPLKKTGKNQTKAYFELEDFLPQTMQAFHTVGLCGLVSFTPELASLTIVDVEDATFIVITSPMGSAKLPNCHEVQNIGAVESYQRRYLWMTAMELVENDIVEAVSGNDSLAQDLGDIANCPTVKALETLWNTLGKEYTDKRDLEGYKAIKGAVVAKKTALEGGA